MKRLVCIEWNETAQTCTVEGWVDEAEPLFPQLTIEQTSELASSILVLLAIGYVFRLLLRQANEI